MNFSTKRGCRRIRWANRMAASDSNTRLQKIRAIRQGVFSFEFSALDSKPEGSRAHAEDRGGPGEIHRFRIAVVNGNAMMTAQGGDSLASPSIASIPVQNARDQIVRNRSVPTRSPRRSTLGVLARCSGLAFAVEDATPWASARSVFRSRNAWQLTVHWIRNSISPQRRASTSTAESLGLGIHAPRPDGSGTPPGHFEPEPLPLKLAAHSRDENDSGLLERQ